MSSGVAPPRQPASVPPEQRSAEYDRFIEDRLEKTRRQVKTVDVATRLAGLLVGVLVYLLAVTLIDHWVVAGGLGFVGRLLLWIGLVAGVSLYVGRFLAPLVIYRINPIFAAYTIEQSRPSFKNSLINFLFLRRRRHEIEKDDLAGHFYHGLQYRTAAELSQVSVEAAVDRTHLLRLAYVLAALVVFCSAYLLISPKNPLVSFQRVIWPWARVGAPTRVSIHAVEPGDAVAYQGESVVVSADVRGLNEGEPVLLVFTTADGQCIDQAIPMKMPEGESRYRCEVPPGSLGIQQDLVYHLLAGDCVAPAFPGVFHIQMQIPLSIVVGSVEYKYPEYTGLAPRTVEKEGDLRGLEGTQVTIRAIANQPIARAFVEFDGDARKTLSMEAHGAAATTQFILQMSRDDPSRPQYGSYQLRFTDPERRENRRPIRHRIEVIPDLRPEVRFVDRPPDETRVPESGSLPLVVRAEDPDFGLRRVTLRAEKQGQGLAIAPLLSKPKPEKAHAGPFERAFPFVPAKLGLKAGDRVLYWAEALDNKEDARGLAPNAAETEKQWLVIVSDDQPRQRPPQQQADQGRSQPKQRPDARKPEHPPREDQKPGDDEKQPDAMEKPAATPADQPQPKQPANKQPGKKSDPRQSGGEKPDQTQETEKSDQSGAENPQEGPPGQPKNDRAGGQAAKSQPQPAGGQDREDSAASAEQDQRPLSPDTDLAEATKRILDYREKQRGQQPPSKPDDAPHTEKPPAEPSQSPGEPNPAANEPTAQKPGEQKAGERKAGEQNPGERKTAQQQPSDQSPEKPQPGEVELGAGQEKKQPSQMDGTAKPQASPPKPSTEPNGPGEKSPPATKAGSQPDKGTAGQKRPTEKQATEKQAAEKPGGPGQSGEDSAGAKPEKPSPGPPKRSDSSQAKPPETPENEPAGGPSKEATAKPDKGQGDRGGTGAGDEREKPKEKPKPAQSAPGKPEPTGGNPESVPGKPSAGMPQAQPQPAPVSEAAKVDRAKPPDKETTPKEDAAPPEPPSPVNNPKTSKFNSDDTPGERAASGGAGGGQQAKQAGTGNSGTKTESEQGGGLSQQPGKEGMGSKAGDGVKSDRSTGESVPDASGRGRPTEPIEGKPTPEQPNGDVAKPELPKGMPTPDQKNHDQSPPKPRPEGDGHPGTGSAGKTGPADQRTGQGGGVPSGGGLPPDPNQPKVPPAPPPPPRPPDDPNLDYARQRVNLTLQTLEEELAKPKSELFERLGWKQSDAERFLRQWQEMIKAAKKEGPRGDQARKDLQKAFRSLGLNPQGTQLREKGATADRLQQQDAGRIPPPADWAELYRAYTKGAAGGKP